MVYIDPTDLTQSRADEIAVFESIGLNAAARDTFYTLMERAMTNAPPALRSEGAVTGQFIVAANSGHMIHVSEPQLVIDAIRRFVR